MKFVIETIGCQQNEYDASRLTIFLKSAGFVETSAKEAEVIFILACSVRQTAVDRIFGRVRNWLKEDKKVYITACVTDDDRKSLFKKGATYFKDFVELSALLNLKTNSSKLEATRRAKPSPLGGASSFYVPIMSGCNNFCSYCVVPYTRGREKSRSVKDIINEVKALIKSGKKEIVLLGQNVNSYQIDQKSKIKNQNDNVKCKSDFVILLEKINNLSGDFEIAFMSNHPKDMTDEVIDAIATLPKVKKEIHLPLQSGSDKILKAMNRPYSSKRYLRLVESLKSKVHKVKITTDIIVGFPGETENEFQETAKVCKKVGFSLAYVNKYSPRKGTASYKLGDPIPWSEKQRRWKILDDLINKKL